MNAYGGIFTARFAYIQEKHGKEGMDQLVRVMRRNLYTGPISSTEFKIGEKYPFEDLIILNESYLEVFGEEALARMAKEVAKKRGIVGFLVRWSGTPDLILRKAAEYWPNFYDFGRLEGEVTGPNAGIVKGFDVSPKPIFCRVLTNYFSGILDNIRVSDVKVAHTKCVHEGADHCEWELTWKD